jgi:hypothetical protein
MFQYEEEWRSETYFSEKPPTSFGDTRVFPGVGIIRDPNGQKGLAIRHWVLAALFLVMPLCSGIAMRRRYTRKIRGLCRVCGYDLRATPERCPECGAHPNVDLGANAGCNGNLPAGY